MSSQLGQSRPASTSPYANVPGYHMGEPANSAWNSRILANHAVGISYQEQQNIQQKQVSQSRPSSLEPNQPTQQTRSTNPALENAIVSSFVSNPKGLTYAGTEKGSYLYGLYQKGVLTSKDFDTISGVSEKYNTQVEKQNAKAQSDYQLSLKNYSSEVIQKARSEGAQAIHIYDQSGRQLDSIPISDAQQALPLALQSFSGKDVYASTKSKQDIQNLQTLARSQNVAARNELKNSLNQYTSQGYIIRITDSSGKVIKETSGARAYHDVIQAQQQFGNNISFVPYYSAKTNLQNVKQSNFFQNPIGTIGEFVGGAIKTGETIAAQQIASFYSAAKAPEGKQITTSYNVLGYKVAVPNENFLPAYVQALKQEGKSFVSSGVNTLEQIGRVAPYVGIPIKEPIKALVNVLPTSLKTPPALAPEAQTFAKQYSSSTAYDILSGQKVSGFTQASLAGSLALGIFITAEPIVRAVPLRGASLGIGIRSLETGKEVATPSRTLLVGYGGAKSIPVFSYVGGKLISGAPKPAQVVPSTYEITSFGRGTQIAAKGSVWETKYLTSQTFLKDLEARGKVIPGTAKAEAAHESIFTTSMGKSAKDVRPKTMAHLETERFPQGAKEAVYTQLGKQQGKFSYLRPSGRVGKIGGSNALYLSLPERYQKAMGKPKDIDIHVSSIFTEGFAASRLTSKLAKKANLTQKELPLQERTAYISEGRSIEALGKVSGKALEIPNPKSEGIENREGSSTSVNESKLFGRNIDRGTVRVRVSKKNRQRVEFVTGKRQLADQIRVASSIQTLETIKEQGKGETGLSEVLQPGAEQTMKGKAAVLPPAFRIKDLVRETLKTEHYAEQFEKKGEPGKAATLRENIITIKGYAQQVYKVDWAKLETEVAKEPVKVEAPIPLSEIARSSSASAAKGFRTSSPIISRPSGRENRDQYLKSNEVISSSIMPRGSSSLRARSASTRSQFESITKSSIGSQRSGKSSANRSILSTPSGKLSGKPSSSSLMSSASSIISSRSISSGKSSGPSKSPSSSLFSSMSSVMSETPSSTPSSSPYSTPSEELLSPPSKPKRIYSIWPWLPNPTQGPGGPGGGGGAKKSYIGNVPEFNFTGMYNRQETIYGRVKTPKMGKLSKATRKSISNRLTKII